MNNFVSQEVNVLLVEDDEVDAEAIRRKFHKHGIKNPLHHVACGREALALLRGENQQEKLPRPYIILLDINMPRMNGLDFLQEVRNDESLRESIAFFLTTSARDIDIAAAYRMNAAGYFLKDNIDELIGMFSTYRQINQFPNETKH